MALRRDDRRLTGIDHHELRRPTLLDDRHEALRHRGERHALDLAGQSAILEHELPQRERARSVTRLATGMSDEHAAQRGFGQRHRHGMGAGHAHQREQVFQRATDTPLFLGDGHQGQAEFLDSGPEVGRPLPFLDTVDDFAGALVAEEAVRRLQQHFSRFAIHGAPPFNAVRGRGQPCRAEPGWCRPEW
ncbi:MAG: hypothetical protein BWY76_02091 [bacterium ADurb.Bin429]|nr:MAG: hypothetical protein BWY76_02091 [bacterium ADurb.Bin429]